MPNIENGTVRIASKRPTAKRRALRVVGEPMGPPRRQRNSERRPREYLTPAEIEVLIATAKKRGRYGQRDATMILIAYRHGLRVSELCALTWDQSGFRPRALARYPVKARRPLGSPAWWGGASRTAA